MVSVDLIGISVVHTKNKDRSHLSLFKETVGGGSGFSHPVNVTMTFASVASLGNGGA